MQNRPPTQAEAIDALALRAYPTGGRLTSQDKAVALIKEAQRLLRNRREQHRAAGDERQVDAITRALGGLATSLDELHQIANGRWTERMEAATNQTELDDIVNAMLAAYGVADHGGETYEETGARCAEVAEMMQRAAEVWFELDD